MLERHIVGYDYLRVKITFPTARSPLSNSKIMPKKRKATPKPARPTPISAKK